MSAHLLVLPFQDRLQSIHIPSGHYRAQFARDENDLDQLFKLRYKVFNLELDEGLEPSHETARDRDEYDQSCDHLIVKDTRDDAVIGTYRLQTRESANAHKGFYSALEFDFSLLPERFLDQAIELGRACVAAGHRNGRVLFLLWKALIEYLIISEKRYFFGCCSLTSQDPAEGKRVMHYLEEHHYIHPLFSTKPQPGYECYDEPLEVDTSIPVKIPRLMRNYLSYDVKIGGPPAMDKAFKTIDYFAILDRESISQKTRKLFFGKE